MGEVGESPGALNRSFPWLPAPPVNGQPGSHKAGQLHADSGKSLASTELDDKTLGGRHAGMLGRSDLGRQQGDPLPDWFPDVSVPPCVPAVSLPCPSLMTSWP